MAFNVRRDVSHDAQSAMLLAMVNGQDLALVLHKSSDDLVGAWAC